MTVNAPIKQIARFSGGVQVTVYCYPAGPQFTVDGIAYNVRANVSLACRVQSHTWARLRRKQCLGYMAGVGLGRIGRMAERDSHTISPTSDGAFSAEFGSQYYLTMDAAWSGNVTPSSGWYRQSAKQCKSAAVSCRYVFVQWNGSGNGAYSGTDNPATVTMSGPIFADPRSFGPRSSQTFNTDGNSEILWQNNRDRRTRDLVDEWHQYFRHLFPTYRCD